MYVELLNDATYISIKKMHFIDDMTFLFSFLPNLNKRGSLMTHIAIRKKKKSIHYSTLSLFDFIRHSWRDADKDRSGIIYNKRHNEHLFFTTFHKRVSTFCSLFCLLRYACSKSISADARVG